MNIYYYIISVATVTLVWAEGELFTYKAKKLSNGSNHHDHLKLPYLIIDSLLYKSIYSVYISVAEECLSTCTTNSLWRYRVGKSYSYSYQVSVVTMMKGTSDEDSSLSMKAQAKFIHSSKCNFQLQVLSRSLKI